MPTWSDTTSEFGRWAASSGTWSSPFAGMQTEYDFRGTSSLFGGVRFDGVTIGPEDTVESATLTITDSYSTATPYVSLFDLDDAPALANGQAGTAKTSPAVEATATTGSTLTVSGLGPQVAQVLSRPGWQSGNALAFYFEALSSAGDMQTRQAATFTLDIVWTPPYDAGPDQTVDPFTTVTLTGTPPGGSWSQVSGESVTLGGSGAVRTFTAPGKMTQHALVFQYGTDPMTVTVNPAQHAIVGPGGALIPTQMLVL